MEDMGPEPTSLDGDNVKMLAFVVGLVLSAPGLVSDCLC